MMLAGLTPTPLWVDPIGIRSKILLTDTRKESRSDTTLEIIPQPDLIEWIPPYSTSRRYRKALIFNSLGMLQMSQAGRVLL